MSHDTASALPRTCCATVWLTPGQALYAGPGLDLAPHSGSVWCLAVGVDGPLTVTIDGRRSQARSALIPPRSLHHLDTQGGRLVSCYLEPTSDRSHSAGRLFAERAGDLATRHVAEHRLISMPDSDATARAWLDRAAPVTPRDIDPRIHHAACRMRDEPSTSSRELAAAAGLSESRFLHLFRAEMDTSVRRYRLWIRLVRAGGALAAGSNLTTAAVDAGFSSPSHLADRFKSAFGLSASQLLGAGLVMRTPEPATSV
ncbi:helix-turn-helix transcriptional regulator [Mycolicibacterium sp. S2-37]|uniref:helix-turn-helix transcriptional regulator n=1 Tax=Mycolicibacterium sp. S2-37 TaxID=2810297 RepID=UPI001A94C476|nr:helix-turn-helix transcriptional regulator [Mycolicibacterium sp. S2-37]MBO0677551.1 helix-turn-helix transcriptional regulator [Mycolicibacterium sp. S2-37]